IESQPFIEAVRQLRHELGPDNVVFIHVSLVPYIAAAHEVKTKPTQHSVKEMRSMGVQPDFIVCRSDHEINEAVRAKIAHFCDVDVDSVLSCVDAPSIYEVPIDLFNQGFDVKVLQRLKLPECELHRVPMTDYVEAAARCSGETHIAVVGKYTSLPDAYLSVIEALGHAGVANGTHARIHLIDGEELDDANAADVLASMDGILVPGGFGQRAFEGKIAAARYAREHNIPYLGICLGLQAAVCEFARHVAGLDGATSAEFADEGTLESADDIPFVIDLMPEQEDIENKGGTMRLGAYPCKVLPGTRAFAAYGSELVYERHRHRYEVSNAFRQQLVEAGLVISGLSPDERLTEMIELPGHPWFVATQAHPEFKSRPGKPHPLFRDFIAAAAANDR
ncbi:MAG: CTP synthase, partial [Coriobacteriaceae bacterium]|nr:CTP synthase [Coriobacteriaceae bacterium]